VPPTAPPPPQLTRFEHTLTAASNGKLYLFGAHPGRLDGFQRPVETRLKRLLSRNDPLKRD
jgi:hypothetical protein